MNIRLCIISCKQELFDDAAKTALDNATGEISLVGFGNGVPLGFPSGVDGHTEHSPTNRGVPYGLHRLWDICKDLWPDPPDEEILCYIHDDFQILEKGWDQRVKAVFARDPRCGLAGFGGATALGGDEIYSAAYEVHQLGRRNFYSNMHGAEVHGERTTEERPIVFTDGQSMILRRDLLDKILGWSWWPFDLIHHAYDYGIACQARRHGYTAWLVPCEVNHLNFQTASQPVYKELAASHGGDAAVHAASHRFVYDTFRDVLPLRL